MWKSASQWLTRHNVELWLDSSAAKCGTSLLRDKLAGGFGWKCHESRPIDSSTWGHCLLVLIFCFDTVTKQEALCALWWLRCCCLKTGSEQATGIDHRTFFDKSSSPALHYDWDHTTSFVSHCSWSTAPNSEGWKQCKETSHGTLASGYLVVLPQWPCKLHCWQAIFLSMSTSRNDNDFAGSLIKSQVNSAGSRAKAGEFSSPGTCGCAKICPRIFRISARCLTFGFQNHSRAIARRGKNYIKYQIKLIMFVCFQHLSTLGVMLGLDVSSSTTPRQIGWNWTAPMRILNVKVSPAFDGVEKRKSTDTKTGLNMWRNMTHEDSWFILIYLELTWSEEGYSCTQKWRQTASGSLRAELRMGGDGQWLGIFGWLAWKARKASDPYRVLQCFESVARNRDAWCMSYCVPTAIPGSESEGGCDLDDRRDRNLVVSWSKFDTRKDLWDNFSKNSGTAIHFPGTLWSGYARIARAQQKAEAAQRWTEVTSPDTLFRSKSVGFQHEANLQQILFCLRLQELLQGLARIGERTKLWWLGMTSFGDFGLDVNFWCLCWLIRRFSIFSRCSTLHPLHPLRQFTSPASKAVTAWRSWLGSAKHRAGLELLLVSQLGQPQILERFQSV